MAGSASSPKRRQLVKAHDRIKRRRHQRPSQSASPLREARSPHRQQRRHKVGKCHPYDGAGQKQRRVIELVVGGARDHAPDIPEARIGAQAVHAVRQAEPDGALPFHRAAKRAIVDERGADRLDAASSFQRIGPHEHAAARRPGHGVLFPVHPARRGRASGKRTRRRGSARVRRGSRSAA